MTSDTKNLFFDMSTSVLNETLLLDIAGIRLEIPATNNTTPPPRLRYRAISTLTDDQSPTELGMIQPKAFPPTHTASE
jgi:hypothetical protein